MQLGGSVTLPTQSSWGISFAVKTEIVGVAGAIMQCGHFVFPSSSQKRESIAFDLIEFYEVLGEFLSPG